MNRKPIPEPVKMPTRAESLMFVASAYKSHEMTSPSMFGKILAMIEAVYDAPHAVQAKKLSREVLSMSSRKILVRAPNVTIKSTRNPVSSFCPNENKNKITQAGRGIFLDNDAKKRITMGRKKPLFEISAQRMAKMSATKAAKTVLLMAIKAERK